ncbi:MAG: hypothetical protein AABX61_02365, partial [Nanoarchaeota archaeon]
LRDNTLIYIKHENWIIKDLYFQGNSGLLGWASAISIATWNGPVKDFLMSNVYVREYANGFSSDFGVLDQRNVFIYDSHFEDIGTPGGGNGIYFGAKDSAILGTIVNKSILGGEHNARVFHGNKLLISHNILHNPKEIKASLKFHNEESLQDGGLGPSKWNLISHNSFNHLVEYKPQNSLRKEFMEDAIFEKNTFERTNINEAVENGFTFSILAQDITVRDNIFKTKSGIEFGGDNTQGVLPSSNINIFGNTFWYGNDAQESGVIWLHSGVTNVKIKNNIAQRTGQDLCCNNQDYFLKTDAFLSELDSNYNIFDSPVNTFAIDNGIVRTLAQWQSQGRDLNSQFIGPLYVDPLKGDFHLQTISPAIDAGTRIPVFDDFEG